MPLTTRNNFTGGIVSRPLWPRSDLQKTQTGMRDCLNMIVDPQGGVRSRNGFRDAYVLTGAQPGARLVPFVFNSDEAYILAFGPTVMSVHQGNSLLDQVSHGFSADQLLELDYTQQNDVMIVTHPDKEPVKVIRLGHTDWRIEGMVFDAETPSPEFAQEAFPVEALVFNGNQIMTLQITNNDSTVYDFLTDKKGVRVADVADPYNGQEATWVSSTIIGQDTNNDDIWLITYRTKDDLPGQYLGTAVVTTAAYGYDEAIYRSGPDGGDSGGGDFKKKYRYCITAVGDTGESLPSATIESESVNSLTEVFGLKLQWGAVEGADYYRIYKEEAENSFRFGWIGDCESTSFIDYNLAPLMSDSVPEPRNPLSGNTPGTAAYYQQRLVFAGGSQDPFTLHATEVGQYESFRQARPIRDADAFSLTASSAQANRIEYLVPMRMLVLLTSGSEGMVTEGNDELFTAASTGVKFNSWNGCARVKPVLAQDSLLYVKERGGRLLDLAYDWGEDAWNGSDQTLFVRDLFDGETIVDMSYAADPDGILWVVTASGKLFGLTFLKEHGVAAWHRHEVAKVTKIHSVASIPEGDKHRVYIAAEIADDDTNLYLMYMDDVGNGEPVVMDWFRSAGTNSRQTLGTGQPNKEVTVVAEGYVYQFTADSEGTVNFGEFLKAPVSGYPFEQRIDTVPMYVPSDNAALTTLMQPIRVAMYLHESRIPEVAAGSDPSSTLEYQAPDLMDLEVDLDEPVLPVSSVEEVRLPAGWKAGSWLSIRMRDPFPLQVLHVEVEYAG